MAKIKLFNVYVSMLRSDGAGADCFVYQIPAKSASAAIKAFHMPGDDWAIEGVLEAK